MTTNKKVNNIRRKIEKLQDKIKLLTMEFLEIQSSCPHPNEHLERKAYSNAGNYDPTSDSYWYDFHCLVCDKRWTTDQSRENTYRGFKVEKLS